MADVFTKSKRSKIMAAVRSQGNRTTEQKFMAILREHRIKGWRRNRRIIGSPDFIFPNHRLAIFVDGCFWHGCQKHLRMPADNRAYWQGKIERNRRRDRVTGRALQDSGWRVLRIWEHELKLSIHVIGRLRKALSVKPTPVQIRLRPKRAT